MQPTSGTWVHFVSEAEIPLGFIPPGGNRIDRYFVQEIRSIRGEAPPGIRPGKGLARIESRMPIPLGTGADGDSRDRFCLRGVMQHLHYTGRSEREELERISRAEPGPGETVAVLIPIGKSMAWWGMSQDERQVLFRKTDRHEGHHGIGRKYADRIFRRLYHSRYVDPFAPYDFLTYFEFKEADVPDFRKLISELRDIKSNPEWLYVDFEYEIWMTKLS